MGFHSSQRFFFFFFKEHFYWNSLFINPTVFCVGKGERKGRKATSRQSCVWRQRAGETHHSSNSKTKDKAESSLFSHQHHPHGGEQVQTILDHSGLWQTHCTRSAGRLYEGTTSAHTGTDKCILDTAIWITSDYKNVIWDSYFKSVFHYMLQNTCCKISFVTY